MTPRATASQKRQKPRPLQPGLLRFDPIHYDAGMLKRGGTRLGVIPKHHLYVECGTPGCEHSAMISVAVLIERCGDRATVGDVLDKMECTRCKQKNVKEVRIIYEGGSLEAMRGAEQR